MRTPETLTAAARAEQLRALGADAMKPDPEQERARASLLAGLNLTPVSASATLDPRRDVDGSFSILNIDDIVPYSKNPRSRPNPRYAEILESIKANNITNPLTVTRRPGEVKYFPYGGGNTRLAIARELAAEGDKRFAQLQVIIRAWTSEADVIAAHLSENENRGDTSFWEKAQGVKSFKEEWERDQPNEILSTPALNDQLRTMGINYGAKMVQNFQFAFEKLAPVGEWLTAREVNSVLRPTLTKFLDLAEKLGKGNVSNTSFQEILGRHAADLSALDQRNAATAPEDAVPVALDTDRLVAEVADSIAKALGVPTARMKAMAELQHQRPRISAQELRQAHTSPEPVAEPTMVGRSLGVGSGTKQPAGQRPQETPTQLQLGAMPGVVGGQNAGSREPDAQQPLANPGTSANTVNPNLASAVELAQAANDLDEELQQVLLAINEIVPIHDFLVNTPEMPFGFFVDLPKEPVDRRGDQAFSSLTTGYREALWLVLVGLSGQTQEEVWEHYTSLGQAHELRWSQLLEQDETGMQIMLSELLPKGLGAVRCIDIGLRTQQDERMGGMDLMIGSAAYWLLENDPALNMLMARLYDVLARMREANKSIFDLRAGYVHRTYWVDQTD
ncbi:MAG: hypothetical protein ACLGJD_11050 [Gammaproteobacteria bacterium]|uniref:hypothetical protein n=1 Tax=uncultured Pseudacidovorax sp. TaxID=679313 RepID=UPI0025CDF4FE|nr:hypothetical protein [uncultured Pseudacidovorax sp.]